MNLLSSTTKGVLLLSAGAMVVLVTAFLVLTVLRAKREEDKDLTLRAIGAGVAIMASLGVGVSAALDLGTSLKPDLSNFFSWLDQSFAYQPYSTTIPIGIVLVAIVILARRSPEVIRRD